MNKMKRLIKHIIFRPFYQVKDGKYYANDKIRRFINKVLYLYHVGKPLRLNHPKDLNEKVIWLKLYSDTSRWAELADKYADRVIKIVDGKIDYEPIVDNENMLYITIRTI